MTNKPVKKSDQEKGWIRPRPDRHFRPNPEFHLIVSEGTRTEPNYFRALAKNINSGEMLRGRTKRDYIQFYIEGVGKNTRDVFEDAVKAAREIQSTESIVFQRVWVVYDKDDFDEDDFNVVQDLCKNQSNEDTKYSALWSNQCIELWFLLHFEYLTASLMREDYCRKLSRHLKQHTKCTKYKKNSNNMFDFLLPFLETAMENSRRLYDSYQNEDTPAKRDPATLVFLIFDELLPYISRP